MHKILLLLTSITLFLFPNINFAQTPDLGTSSGFALFTAAGAFDNVGATFVTGDIGTNVGLLTGFPLGTVTGDIHVADPASVQAAIDVDVAYDYLHALTCGQVLGTTLGNNQVLTPNVYCIGALSAINGDLVLDGQNDPNALFIFQIDGALSTSASSTVSLINMASLQNVYWQINGAFEAGDNSVFRGNILANGAISLLDGSSLFGRGLSRGGAISLHRNVSTLGIISPLEIKLSDIQASNKGPRNLISWVTETESKGDVAELERSNDGNTFTQISIIEATGKPGLYTYWDEHPFMGMNYYRLKMTDAPGSIAYSRIVTANRNAVTEFAMEASPNPVSDILTVMIDGILGNNPTISVSETGGKKVKEMTLRNNKAEVNITDLVPGVYLLKYRDDIRSETIKINKQ